MYHVPGIAVKVKELLLFKPKKELSLVDVVETQIQKDAVNIQKVCAKYRGSIAPWLPIKSQIHVKNFYLDQNRKLGWCVNPKVRFNVHNSINLIILIVFVKYEILCIAFYNRQLHQH